MKLYHVLTAVAVSALVSTGAFAGGISIHSGGGSSISQGGGVQGIYATGGAGAQGSVDVVTAGRDSGVSNTSSTGTVNGVGVGVVGGFTGGCSGGCVGGIGLVGAAGGVSSSNNTVTTSNTYGDIQSNTSATNASGVGIGGGGNHINAGGGNTISLGIGGL